MLFFFCFDVNYLYLLLITKLKSFHSYGLMYMFFHNFRKVVTHIVLDYNSDYNIFKVNFSSPFLLSLLS